MQKKNILNSFELRQVFLSDVKSALGILPRIKEASKTEKLYVS